jgi:hypothetical protein
MKPITAVLAGAVLAGCAAPVSGTAAPPPGVPVATTRPAAPTTARTTTRPATTTTRTVPAPPTAIDPGAHEQYCEHLITGALGKRMQVVVVETAAGRITCDQAGALLADYYAARPDPEPGSAPLEVAGFACNQVPEPDLPQVICTDGDSLLYSMWPQGGG